jgi:hypothetical protein
MQVIARSHHGAHRLGQRHHLRPSHQPSLSASFTAAKHVLGLCIGKAGERAKYWVNLLARAA